MLDFSDIKLGKVIIFQDKPCVVTACYFSKVTKGKPTKKCKIKNLITGLSMDYTFKAGERIEEADLRKEKANYLYASDGSLSFMTVESYETVEIEAEMLGGKEGYLKDGLEVLIVYFNDNPITVDLPIKVSYKIIQTSDAIKGNSVSDIEKDAIIETGLTVKVPAFIKEGEFVLINTVEDEYAGRDTEKNSK